MLAVSIFYLFAFHMTVIGANAFGGSSPIAVMNLTPAGSPEIIQEVNTTQNVH